jgi:hypothetical protein
MINFFTVVMNKLWHGARFGCAQRNWGKEHGANLAVIKDIFLTSSFNKESLAEFSQAKCTMQIAKIHFN